MHFRCTRSLRQTLGIADSDVSLPDDTQVHGLWDWHCRVADAGRSWCLLFTQTTTLYSVVAFGVVPRTPEHLARRLRSSLQCVLGADGFARADMDFLLGSVHDTFGATRGASIVGSMNDFARMLKWHIVEAGGVTRVDLLHLYSGLNDAPMGALGMETPLHALRAALSTDRGRAASRGDARRVGRKSAPENGGQSAA